MQKSLIIRIYRREQQRNQHGVYNKIFGTIENVQTSNAETFSTKDELWRLINNEADNSTIDIYSLT